MIDLFLKTPYSTKNLQFYKGNRDRKLKLCKQGNDQKLQKQGRTQWLLQNKS